MQLGSFQKERVEVGGAGHLKEEVEQLTKENNQLKECKNENQTEPENVNQIEEEFDPDRPALVVTESSAPAEEGEQSGATNYSPATAETGHSGRELNCCCVIS